VFVVPVVDDVLQKIDITTGRYLLEEIGFDRRAAMGNSLLG